jgi:glutamyl-Q tRNA(Asp) synthetase
LHLGSLLAAAGSYLSARSQQGEWLVRMEDLDRDREVTGAAGRILATLEQFGFAWDGPVEYQSRRTAHYEAAIARLTEQGLAFECSCSRSQLARLRQAGDGEPVYPGTCRRGARPTGLPTALRFNSGEPGRVTRFLDRLQGPFGQDVAREVGDFVIRRRDGIAAYQLAVVVDDAAQGITEVVRGSDLLDNTPRQILLQQALGLPTPDYCHLPLLVEPDGSKLAKRERAVALDAGQAPALLWQALRLLRQSPPEGLQRARLAELWDWALAHWTLEPLRGVRTVAI